MAMSLRSKKLRSFSQSRFPYSPPHPRTPLAALTINHLPDELLLHVLSYLTTDQLTRTTPHVCKRWHYLHSLPTIYQSFVFVDLDPATSVAVRLVSMAPWLKTLHLYDRHDADAILRQVGASNARLEKLVLQDCRGSPTRTNVTSHSLRHVINRCGNLRHLYLQDTFCGSRKFYVEIGLKLASLRNLVLMPSRYFTSDALLNITNCCQRIEVLQVFSFDEEDSRDSALISDEAFQTFCDRFWSSLRNVTVNCTLLSDLSMRSLSRCAHLATLHLHNACHVTDAGIMTLSHVTHLSDLAVSRADLVTSPGWQYLLCSRHLAASLTQLVLHWCEHVTDDVCKMAVRQMPRLQHLGLAGNNITEHGHLEVLQLLSAQCICAFTNEYGVYLSNVH